MREGRADAEIAVRLGVSVDAVRARIFAILGELEFSDRAKLRDWNPRPPRKFGGALRPLFVAIAGVAVLGALLIFAPTAGSDSEGTPASSEVSTPSASPASGVTPAPPAVGAQAAGPPPMALSTLPLPFEQHEDYREYTSDQLAAAGFVDTGPFIEVASNPLPVARASYRAGFTALRIDAAGSVAAQSDVWRLALRSDQGWDLRRAAGLTATIDGVPLYAVFSAEWGKIGPVATTELVTFGNQELAFYPLASQPPEVILAVRSGASEQIPAIVDVLGHLWVRLNPLPPGPTADDTGERIDISDALALGPLAAGRQSAARLWVQLDPVPAGPVVNDSAGPPEGWASSTWCEGGPCVAIVHMRGGPGLAAVGTATCEAGAEALTIDLSTEAVTLRFVGRHPNAGSLSSCANDFPRAVVAGQLLSPHGSWRVSAFTSEGTQLGVAADRQRMLYIDVQQAISTCPPCYTGS